MFASMAFALFHNTRAHSSLSPGWTTHKFFNPDEDTLKPPASLARLNPPILNPAQEGSFARHTLLKRLPDTATRVLRDNEATLPQDAKDSLLSLSEEVPNVPLRTPDAVEGGATTDIKHFNQEWDRWTRERASGNWTIALPLISTEMYYYRRILDATKYFLPKDARHLMDPFESQKKSSLASALASKAFLEAADKHLYALEHGPLAQPNLQALFLTLVHASLWSNQGDLALAPSDVSNVQMATQICTSASSKLLVDDTAAAFDLLLRRGADAGAAKGVERVDIINDNSGVELLCDLVLADFLLAHHLAQAVRLHVKGEPLFVSDAMPKDVSSHLEALSLPPAPAPLQALAQRLRQGIEQGRLQVQSHMFWTAPRLFWEMPLSLASELSQAALVVVKGDANYRRLVGDRQWDWLTPLPEVIGDWFPSSALVLRTFKAEIAVGLREGQAAAAAEADPEWLTNGKFASIQFVPKLEAQASN